MTGLGLANEPIREEEHNVAVEDDCSCHDDECDCEDGCELCCGDDDREIELDFNEEDFKDSDNSMEKDEDDERDNEDY